MRSFSVAVLLMLASAAHAQLDEDDPKLARRPAVFSITDDDDPKLARGLPPPPRSRLPTHVAPRFKLAYRSLTTANLDPGEITFHAVELDYYPSSFRFFRFGLDTEIAYAGGPYNLWYFTVGPTVGFQFPWRVTPFVDARFVAGLAGGAVDGVVAVSYIYVGGLDFGAELYVAGRFFLTGAVGWAHPVFRGADVAFIRAHPMFQAQTKEFSADTFTFKVGLGF
jgi:hypothetical protein